MSTNTVILISLAVIAILIIFIDNKEFKSGNGRKGNGRKGNGRKNDQK